MVEFISVTGILLFLLSLVIWWAFYVSIGRNWSFFIERNITFRRGLPLLGSFYPAFLFQKSLPECIEMAYSEYSNNRFIGMYDIGGKPSYMVRDPDLIRDITIKDFDHFVNHFFQLNPDLDPILGRAMFSMSNQPWRDMRSTISPLFTGSKMRFMLSLINETANNFTSYVRGVILKESKTTSLEFNMMDLLSRLVNDIIGSTAFGLQLNTLEDPDNELFRRGSEIAYSITSLKAFFIAAFPRLAVWFNIKILTNDSDSFFREIIRSTIDERRKRSIVRNDMLHLLLLAKEGKLNDMNEKYTDQDTGFATISEMVASKTNEKLKNWSEDELVAQCVVFFLAGFNGVSSTFCFLCYELSKNPDIQERLYEEIMETQEKMNGKPVSFEALQQMKYLDMVVSEILRLWPVGSMTDRLVTKQYLLEDVDGTKALLQPGELVWIPTFGIHRDPKYYPNPEVFDPKRFSDENKKNIKAGTYIPFGIGPRACIASRFALMQLKSIMYSILLELKIECSSKTPSVLQLKTGTNAYSFFNNWIRGSFL